MSEARNLRQGPIEIDFDEYALVVNFEWEMILVDKSGRTIEVLERRPDSKRIKIRALTADKKMALLAEEIVDKCKYIHESRKEEVEQLLIKLQKHWLKNNKQSEAGKDDRISSNAAQRRDNNIARESPSDFSRDSDYPPQRQQERQSRPLKSPEDNLPEAVMENLSDYMELLYPEAGKTEKEKEKALREQERGTAMILKLCRDVMNLEQIIQNGSAMGALTRILQEEYKKSLEISFNILRIFVAFSNFGEMHPIMAQYRIGVLTMKAIEFEIKRGEVREAEAKDREDAWAAELSRTKKENLSDYPSVAERIRQAREKEATKQRIFVRKQNKLLFVGFYILLNLAEDIGVEKKMIKKALLPSLMAMLSRNMEDLLVLTLTFLKKLSIIDENVAAMKEMGAIKCLMKFVPCSSQKVVTIALRLLFNLSFDAELRAQMVKGALLPKLVNLLKVPVFRAKTLKLLYHLSVDDQNKSFFAYSDAIPILMGMVINFPQDILPKELAALMVNLSLHKANCEHMIANKGLNLLMDRFMDKRDIMLLKIIRNLTLWTFNQQQDDLDSAELTYKFRGLWGPHIKSFLELLREYDNQDMVVEIIGCLANMTSLDLPVTMPWAKILKEYQLLNIFSRMLVPGMVQVDLLLEIVMLISAMASDSDACAVFASSTIIGLLYQLWKEKAGDDTELLLQLIHCFHKFFLHEATREEAMYNTRVVVDIIDCLAHRNGAIRSKAEKLCTVVLEYDRKKTGEPGQLGREIIRKRFESYNRLWISTVLHGGGGGGMNGQQMLMNNHSPSTDSYGYGGHEVLTGGGGGGRMSHEDSFLSMQNVPPGYYNDRMNQFHMDHDEHVALGGNNIIYDDGGGGAGGGRYMTGPSGPGDYNDYRMGSDEEEEEEDHHWNGNRRGGYK